MYPVFLEALIEEFEKLETKESKFARMCDKLEADIQAKIYCEEKSIKMYDDKNAHLLQDDRIKGLIDEEQIMGKTIIRLWPLTKISIIK